TATLVVDDGEAAPQRVQNLLAVVPVRMSEGGQNSKLGGTGRGSGVVDSWDLLRTDRHRAQHPPRMPHIDGLATPGSDPTVRAQHKKPGGAAFTSTESRQVDGPAPSLPSVEARLDLDHQRQQGPAARR